MKNLLMLLKRPQGIIELDFGVMGGELVYGRITKEAYKFWNDVKEGKTELDRPRV